VIRIVTLDPFDPADLTFLTRTLFQSFGLGTEHTAEKSLPRESETKDGRHDAVKLLQEVEGIRTIGDDKVLYLTHAPLAVKPGPFGEPPCTGFAVYSGAQAVVSTERFPPRGVTEASIEAWQRRLARESIHAIGHLWDLHHCYDGRCPMHPSWSPSVPQRPEMDLCNFCREKSERRIRLAKT
jgi:archaemetzincin